MAEETEAKNEAVENQSSDKVSLTTLFGIKAGMTRIFDENGNHVPLTVIKLIPNYISQVKTKEKDGYEAYQIAYYEKRESLVNKPMKGHTAKAKIPKAMARSAEVLISGSDQGNLGKELSFDEFQPNIYVDATGSSKGKGFQGVMKKFGFKGGPAAHGSHFHRTGGAIGCRATPGRVFAGKKMPGHLGAKTVTVQNIQVVENNSEKGYLLLKGSVPGAKNSFLRISLAKKKSYENSKNK